MKNISNALRVSMKRTQERLKNNQEGTAITDRLGFFGNVWVRAQYYVSANDVHAGHLHDHDHMSLVITGSVRVEVEGRADREIFAPDFFQVPANKKHKITALEDGTCCYCVFAVRDENGQPMSTTTEVKTAINKNENAVKRNSLGFNNV